MSFDEISAIHLRLDKQDVTLNAIHTAIVGDPAMGQEGVIPRIKAVEARLDANDRTMLKWVGVATGMSFMAGLLKDKIFH